jgi:fatty-acyl-CoA synthase
MANEGIGTWIARRRVKSHDRAALVFEGTALTYSDLADRIDRLASALTSLGVARGDRVAFFGDNHPSFLETLFATTLIGAIFVPLNTRLAQPEIAYALTDSGSTVLVHSQALATVAAGAAASTSVRARIVVSRFRSDDVDPRTEIDYESLLEGVASGSADVAVGLDDPALILYTSGTTGRPKGALLRHGDLTWNAIDVLVDYDLTSTDVALMISPLFHAASLGMGALPAFLKGATVVLEARFDAARALALIEEHGVTWVSGVPTTFQLMAEHPDWPTADLRTLRSLTCGGSPVPLRVIDAYERRGLSFTGGYGLTEASPGVTSLQPSRSRSKAGSAGLPHFFTSVRLRGPHGEQIEPGAVGEIQVSGPHVIKEYWNRPADSAEAFVDDVWFRTGDVGSMDDEGFLFVSDRLKDMIISGGENVYPAEVEMLLLELEAVSGAAVFGVPHEKWGEVPVAVVTLREGVPLSPEAIIEHLDGRIARYKIPQRVEVLDELPRTASGKVRKAELRARYAG